MTAGLDVDGVAGPMPRKGRPRGQRIDVWVTHEERSEIMTRATTAGMSLSAYARATALNHRIRSVYDLDAVTDLVKVGADLSCAAGLLKLWLVERPGEGVSRSEVQKLMSDFRELQASLSTLMVKAVK